MHLFDDDELIHGGEPDDPRRGSGMTVYYSPLYCKAKHAWDTTRKASNVAQLLADDPIDNVRIVEPEPLTLRQLELAHDPKYIRAVENGVPKRLAESNGFEWCPWLPLAVRSSNGGMVAAMRSALRDGVSGTLSSGLHHASYERGGGFCTFNGLAIAAIEAVQNHGKTVLIVDYDAHYGDGTMDIIDHYNRMCAIDHYDRIDMIDISTGKDSANGYDGYLRLCMDRLHDALGKRQYDLVLYNAGADPHEKCHIGGRDGVTTDVLAYRETMVFEACRNIPIAFCLAGGYSNSEFTADELARCHWNTVRAASRIVSP